VTAEPAPHGRSLLSRALRGIREDSVKSVPGHTATRGGINL